MVEHLKSYSASGEDFIAKDMMTNFTLDCIATCGYGVETNSFADPNGKFKQMVSNC